MNYLGLGLSLHWIAASLSTALKCRVLQMSLSFDLLDGHYQVDELIDREESRSEKSVFERIKLAEKLV